MRHSYNCAFLALNVILDNLDCASGIKPKGNSNIEGKWFWNAFKLSNHDIYHNPIKIRCKIRNYGNLKIKFLTYNKPMEAAILNI